MLPTVGGVERAGGSGDRGPSRSWFTAPATAGLDARRLALPLSTAVTK